MNGAKLSVLRIKEKRDRHQFSRGNPSLRGRTREFADDSDFGSISFFKQPTPKFSGNSYRIPMLAKSAFRFVGKS